MYSETLNLKPPISVAAVLREFRYNDIICIDSTRVVLKDRPSDDDYIHASWMTMPDQFKYICTQVEKETLPLE
ncbi:hypothetical protein COOONC_28244 [Cooperia oncophora]